MTRRAILVCSVLAACSTRATGRTIPAAPEDPTDQRAIRVAIMVTEPRISATGAFTWYDAQSGSALAVARGGDQWRVERDAAGARVRAISPAGSPTSWQRVLQVRAATGLLTVNAKRYRGSLAVVPVDTGLVVVNRLGIEDYLRGVVPIELGTRAEAERAALETQTVAARTYAYNRMASSGEQPFDVKGSIADQAYGGYEVEYPLANGAIDRTRGLVLLYDGRPANAVYSSTCGGTTARASEVWRATPDQPYLVAVSDAIAGTDRHYCDIAPRFRWTRSLAAAEVDAALAQYLAAYASGGPNGSPGRARMISVRSRTATDRVDVLDVETDAGTYVVRKNDTRYVLRAPGGETLNSTYFSVEPEIASDGALRRITLRGRGYGHGVGMCQWGAIGRARAGQSFRTILRTYYPGTTVGPLQ
jgi:stage II sporulation protein D